MRFSELFPDKKIVFLALILSFILFPILDQAAEPSACIDFAAQVCSGAQDVSKSVSDQLQKLKAPAVAAFKEFISSPAGRKLKKEILKAAPPASNCSGNSDSDSCNGYASEQLNALYILSERDPTLVLAVSQFNTQLAYQITQSPDFQTIAKKITSIDSPDVSAEVKSNLENQIIPNTRKLLIETIKSLNLDEKTKSTMIQKVQSVSFELKDCGETTDHNTGLLRNLIPNAEFDNIRNTISVCPAYVQASANEFDLTAVVAHELGHSIDPCNMTDDYEKVPLSEMIDDTKIDNQYLKQDFLACLRSDSSISAKSFRILPSKDDQAADWQVLPDYEEKGVFENSTARTCHNDQITESVADWFSAEVTAKYAEQKHLDSATLISKISKVYRPICGSSSDLTDVHPPTKDRLNYIFAVQPSLRKMMGCKTEVKGKQYCDINNPKSLIRANKPSLLQPAKSSGAKQ